MKKIFIFLLVSVFVTVNASGQKSVPENVKIEFAKKYPSAQSVKWNSEEVNEWEAEFKSNGTEMSASFDNNGIWLESEAEIGIKDLPEAVTATIAKKFEGFITGEVLSIENPKMKGFEVQLKKEDTSLEVIFDNTGKVIKSKETNNEKGKH